LLNKKNDLILRMINNVMKYLFSFYILLFIGSSSLFANNQDCIVDLSPKEKDSSSIVNSSFFLNFQTVHSTLDKENVRIRASDNELVEEELISKKRELVSSAFFSSVLYAEQLGYLCSNIKKRNLHNKFFVNNLSHKVNIVFCVFII
jgi:hypothetical protein